MFTWCRTTVITAAALLTAVGGGVAVAAVAKPTIALEQAGPVAFEDATPSAEARRVADWVMRSADNGGLPFMIVDKINARLFLFDADGGLRTTTPVLLGLARGDDSPLGIGARKLSAITPAERITPAGRFIVETGVDLVGHDILWIDYDTAIALHRVSDHIPNSGRSRNERLAGTSATARRVSLGCVNVTATFFDSFIRPTFSRSKGIVYILPETRSATTEFAIADNPATARMPLGR